MESRGVEDSKNVKTSQAYFFEGFISFFEDFSLTISIFVSQLLLYGFRSSNNVFHIIPAFYEEKKGIMCYHLLSFRPAALYHQLLLLLESTNLYV